MRYIRPIFYDKFSCTADKCPDTCCAGWQIMIDQDSLDYYGEVQGEFGKRLRNSIDWQEGAFRQINRRCAFLNEQNLCDLYTALGSEALCDTCRKYPRHVEEYEGLREWSLSLSCPVAAQIILSQQGFPEFLIEEDEEPDELEEEFEDFDLLLFTQLDDARKAVFDGLKEQKHSLQEKMQGMLWLAARMQECLDAGEFYKLENVIAAYQNTIVVRPDEDLYHKYTELYHLMWSLERLRPEWTDVLKEMYRTLYDAGAESYQQIREEFYLYLKTEQQKGIQWENIGLQLLVFFVYTYFCGAVYDDWIYSKMALAVHSVEFLRELFMARWKRSGKLGMEDYIELSYRYAREIEHSDQNLNDLEDFFLEYFSRRY